MRLPRLGGYDTPVAHGLGVYVLCAGLLRFQTHVFIAGHSFARRQPRGSQHLDTVADRENPLSMPVECPHNVQDLGIVRYSGALPPSITTAAYSSTFT